MQVRMIFARDHEGKRYPCESTPEVEESLAQEWIERGIAEPLVSVPELEPELELEPEPEPIVAEPTPAPTKKAK